MARSNFALGVLIGGLAGLAAGYLLSRNGQAGADLSAPDSIDLTPALELRQSRAAAAGARGGDSSTEDRSD